MEKSFYPLVLPHRLSQMIPARENQPDDYPYTGILFATQNLYAYNPVKQFGVQTELQAGVSGPAALAKQTQTIFHRITGNKKPMGWDNQLCNKLIPNINFTAEKGLIAQGHCLQVIAGGYVPAGTFTSGAGNRLLEQGYATKTTFQQQSATHDVARSIYFISGGVAGSRSKFSTSVVQRITRAVVPGLYKFKAGNISEFVS